MIGFSFADFVFTLIIVFFVWASTVHVKNEIEMEKSIAATGHSMDDLISQKIECEKSGDECVMVFDFVPVKKEK